MDFQAENKAKRAIAGPNYYEMMHPLADDPKDKGEKYFLRSFPCSTPYVSALIRPCGIR